VRACWENLTVLLGVNLDTPPDAVANMELCKSTTEEGSSVLGSSAVGSGGIGRAT
jgi:hypothetical protein